MERDSSSEEMLPSQVILSSQGLTTYSYQLDLGRSWATAIWHSHSMVVTASFPSSKGNYRGFGWFGWREEKVGTAVLPGESLALYAKTCEHSELQPFNFWTGPNQPFSGAKAYEQWVVHIIIQGPVLLRDCFVLAQRKAENLHWWMWQQVGKNSIIISANNQLAIQGMGFHYPYESQASTPD